MNRSESFGRLATGVASASKLLELESTYGRQERFADLERLLDEFLVRSLKGERLLVPDGQDESGVAGQRTTSLRWDALSESARVRLNDLFALEGQQSRGAWFLPDEASVKLQLTQFVANFRNNARFANTIISERRQRVALAGSPIAVFYWAVLEPLFEDLYRPFRLRSEQSGRKTREQQLGEWRVIDELYHALGLDVQEQLSVMRYGGGWSKLRAPEQLAAKSALATAIEQRIEVGIGARCRAYKTLPLIQRYYGQAKADGRALRKRVLTRQFERALSGFFGGDWLAFLDYLEEEPHPEEQIATALPDTKLYIGTFTKSQEVAAEHGIDEQQLDLILGALYGTGDRSSPVQRRLDVLTKYWKVFDELHAQQRSGMQPLWGLVEENRLITVVDSGSPPQEGLYRRPPTALLNEIEDCWGTAMLARWPERVVTEPFPHASMAETLGPALKFWQGCALTAWFLCEGPYSRTDMTGLEHYHRREIIELENIGTPIDKRIFRELIDGESRLGPTKPIYETVNETELDSGITLRTAFSGGSRREGFEQLRDVITKYRRIWADRHLEVYLRTRAEGDIRKAVRDYYKSTYDRGGKPPTAKQFAKVAHVATNHWFGGDLGALYRAFGEKSPVKPQRVHLMPLDRELFVTTVYTALGGTRERWDPYIRDENEGEAHKRRIDANHERQDLAQMALDYVRLEEALGHKPDLKQFGQRKFENRARVLDDELEKAWRLYTAVIEESKASRQGEGELVHRFEQSSTSAEPQGVGSIAPAETSESEQGSREPEPKKQTVNSWFRRLIGR